MDGKRELPLVALPHVLRMMALAIETHEREELPHVLNGLAVETK